MDFSITVITIDNHSILKIETLSILASVLTKKCYPLKKHSQKYINILYRVSSRVLGLRENFNGWWNSGWKTSRDICSHAKMCVPCYASLSDNERNEMRELVLPCYVHPSVRLPAGIGGSYSSPANAFLPCSLVNFTCLFNPFTTD